MRNVAALKYVCTYKQAHTSKRTYFHTHIHKRADAFLRFWKLANSMRCNGSKRICGGNVKGQQSDARDDAWRAFTADQFVILAIFCFRDYKIDLFLGKTKKEVFVICIQ